MKKISILFCLFSLCFISGKAQTVTPETARVYNSKGFTFYGYDYTHLRIADATRKGQVVKPFFTALDKLLAKEFPRKRMEILLRSVKDSIHFNLVPTDTLNKKINNGKIVTTDPQFFPADSLPAFVNKYDIAEKQGIGYVIIFECFDREGKNVSAYLVFFDIPTRNILYKNHVVSHEGNGYNYISDWKHASITAIERLIDHYSNDRKAYLKPAKSE